MEEQTACTQDYPAVHSGEYQEGDARAVHLGEIELKDGRVFNGVILEFPAGPPALPISVIWNGTPLTLSIKVSP
jgi:hypothetical protein